MPGGRRTGRGGGRAPYAPRTFALTVPDERDRWRVLAYGMTLPDGSAVLVGADDRSSIICRCTDPQTAARLYAADLIWTSQPGSDPAGPAGRGQLTAGGP